MHSTNATLIYYKVLEVQALLSVLCVCNFAQGTSHAFSYTVPLASFLLLLRSARNLRKREGIHSVLPNVYKEMCWA